MKGPERESLDLYYREAGSWADDRQAAEARSRRVAWRVAAAVCGVALLEGLALVFLTPLKTVQPYTLLVDRQTGFVEELRPLDGNRVTPDAALTRSFLVQYVISRESFAIDTLQADYRKVALWSAESARSDYLAGAQATNPNSLLATLPRTTVIQTRVKSVSMLNAGLALVRFDTIRRDAGGPPQPARPWVAIVRYRYSDTLLSQEDRFVNPLGFQVVRYQRDQEAVAPDPEPTPAAAAPVYPVPATPAAIASPGGYPVLPGVPTNPRPRPGE